MSLHDEFVAASIARGNRSVPWELQPVSGQLALFSDTITDRVRQAILRTESGEALYGGDSSGLVLNFETNQQWSREFDFKAVEALPGYRRLVEAASDPDTDIAFNLAFKHDHDRSGRLRLTMTVQLQPEKRFVESVVRYEDAYDTRKLFFKNIAEDGIPSWAQKKPKAKLGASTLPKN